MGNDLFTDNVKGDLYDVITAAEGLSKVLGSIRLRLDHIFSGVTLAQYFGEALKASGRLDKELLVMRLALGKLRVAIGDAFAPIGQVVLPLLNDAIFAAIRFTKSAGKIIRALFGIQGSADDAAEAEDAYASAVSSAGSAAQRSLASFDKLNRLQKKTAGGGSSSSVSSVSDSMNLKEYLIFNTLYNMLEPLTKIDLSPLTESLQKLHEAMLPITEKLFEGLRWAWDNIFVPIIAWSAEILLPAVLETLSVALDTLNKVIEACKPALIFLWENFLVPLGQWAGQYLLSQLESFQEKLNNIAFWAEKFPISGQQLLVWLNQLAGELIPTSDLLEIFNLVTGNSTQQVDQFGLGIGGLVTPIAAIVSEVGVLMGGLKLLDQAWGSTADAGTTAKSQISQAWSDVSGWFTSNVFDPLESGFKDTGNGILGIFGGVSGGATSGMNGLIKAINQMKFTIPSWVPLLGGKKFGFNIPLLSTPQIPLLAKGAVLPANKPFLAVVGDQRHGTNVEAPLSTIQDAVRIELQDMIDSNLAGQEVIAGVLRQILEAVLGISITDGDIAMAADRYHSKMAVVRGSLL